VTRAVVTPSSCCRDREILKLSLTQTRFRDDAVPLRARVLFFWNGANDKARNRSPAN
jgi:hypothetical protein